MIEQVTTQNLTDRPHGVVPDPCGEAMIRNNWLHVKKALEDLNRGPLLFDQFGNLKKKFIDNITNNIIPIISNGGLFLQVNWVRFTITALTGPVGLTTWVTATADYYWGAPNVNGTPVGTGASPIYIFIPPGMFANRQVGDIGVAMLLGTIDDRLTQDPTYAFSGNYTAIYIEQEPSALKRSWNAWGLPGTIPTTPLAAGATIDLQYQSESENASDALHGFTDALGVITFGVAGWYSIWHSFWMGTVGSASNKGATVTSFAAFWDGAAYVADSSFRTLAVASVSEPAAGGTGGTNCTASGQFNYYFNVGDKFKMQLKNSVQSDDSIYPIHANLLIKKDQ